MASQKKPFLGIQLQADDFAEWRLVWLLMAIVWMLKKCGIDPDWEKIGERISYGWRVIRRPLLIVCVAPIVVKFGLPWLIWQILRVDVTVDWSFKTMLTIGIAGAGVSWLWSFQQKKQEELDLAAEKVVRSVLATTSRIDEEVKFDYLKAEDDGSMVLEFKPGVSIEKFGDEIADQIRVACEDATRHSWIHGTRPDTIRITTYVNDLPTLVHPDIGQIGQPDQEDLVWLGINEQGESLVWDTGHAVHMLITGETGGGKGVAARLILVHAALHGWDISVIDPKGGPDYSWCKRAGISVKEYRGESHDLYGMREELGYAADEMLRRTRRINQHNDRVRGTGEGKEVENWRQYTAEVDPEAKRMLVLLDEAKAFRDLFNTADPELKDDLKGLWDESVTDIQRITSLGRSAGIHFVIMTQRGDVSSLGGANVGSAINNNLPARLVCGMASPTSMRMGLGIEDKTDLGALETAGRCKYRRLGPGPARVYTGQVGFIRAGEVLTEWPKLVPQQRQP